MAELIRKGRRNRPETGKRRNASIKQEATRATSPREKRLGERNYKRLELVTEEERECLKKGNIENHSVDGTGAEKGKGRFINAEYRREDGSRKMGPTVGREKGKGSSGCGTGMVGTL